VAKVQVLVLCVCVCVCIGKVTAVMVVCLHLLGYGKELAH
jgi:hypothetical protein